MRENNILILAYTRYRATMVAKLFGLITWSYVNIKSSYVMSLRGYRGNTLIFGDILPDDAAQIDIKYLNFPLKIIPHKKVKMLEALTEL